MPCALFRRLAVVAVVLSAWIGFSVERTAAPVQAQAKAQAANLRVPGVAETDAACARCHADITKRYLTTAMARASGNAVDAAVPGSFTHQLSGVTYKVGVENGEAWLEYSRPATKNLPALEGRQQLALFVGSGHRGRTYLYHVEDWWFEAPINFYNGKQGYDMAPNFLSAKEMPFNLPVDAGCLHCHASAVEMQAVGSRNRYPGPNGTTALPFLQGGITCEACHGDASAHVASEGKVAMINPAKLTPERRDAVCYRCHLEGETNVQNPKRSPAEFVPGDRLEDFVTYFVRAGNTATTARAVSQVEALNLSGCKRASGDRMTCTTCHDPHGDPPAGERVAYYRARCTQCHAAEKFVSLSAPHAHHPEQADCTACHMPRVATEDIAHNQSTDHRIPRRLGEYEASAAMRNARLTTLGGAGATPQQDKLVPVPGTTATSRDLAVATFELISLGDAGAADVAGPMLKRAREQDPKDAQVLSDLGWLAQHKDEKKQAGELYAEALKQEPASIPANTNYGVLLAQAGQLQDAARLWNGVFRLNPGISELGYDLGEVECALGNRPAAERILGRLLLFSPDDRRARKLLQEISSEQKKCGQ
jgi:hypothetical protein